MTMFCHLTKENSIAANNNVNTNMRISASDIRTAAAEQHLGNNDARTVTTLSQNIVERQVCNVHLRKQTHLKHCHLHPKGMHFSQAIVVVIIIVIIVVNQNVVYGERYFILTGVLPQASIRFTKKAGKCNQCNNIRLPSTLYNKTLPFEEKFCFLKLLCEKVNIIEVNYSRTTF